MACNATLMFCVLVYKRFRAVRGPQPGFAMCYSAYVACVTQREEITDETTAVSKWNFVLIALLDTCMLLLTVIPGGRVPAPLTVILLQAATPAQLGVGALFRSFRCVPHAGVAGAFCSRTIAPRSRYRWTHWSGGLAILVAAVVSMVPILFRSVCCVASPPAVCRLIQCDRGSQARTFRLLERSLVELVRGVLLLEWTDCLALILLLCTACCLWQQLCQGLSPCTTGRLSL